MENSTKHLHLRHWKARLSICLSMLVLAFIALILINFHARLAWFFIRLMAFVDAALSFWLFWYLNRGKHIINGTTIWHQLVHWIGLLSCVYLVASFVHAGIIGSNQAGFIVLTILALGIFLAGVYTEPSFILIGIVLGVFAIGAAYIETYLSVFMLPVLLVAGVVIFIFYHRSRNKAHHDEI